MEVHLPKPHPKQNKFIISTAKRKIIRAGRRSGKTVGCAILAVEEFLKGGRPLYGAPTQEQIDRFWTTCKRALVNPIKAGVFIKNETLHTIERPGTEQRLKAKTAWNADTLRGDYASLLILDEFQLMNESAWNEVGAPMLLDNNGDAIFVYTPPSIRSRRYSKATDPLHAAKMYKKAVIDKTGRWEAFHFNSMDNPHLSEKALAEIAQDMTQLSYRQEILAEDIEAMPGALWALKMIDDTRVTEHPSLIRIVIGVDPEATSGEKSADTGIVACGLGNDGHGYVLGDYTIQGTPNVWGSDTVKAFFKFQADRIVAEQNNGGEMVEFVIRTINPNVPYKAVHASRGKVTRAEPIAAFYEQGRIHHAGFFPELEDQMTNWVPGMKSPDRMDAMVWGFTDLFFPDSMPITAADLTDDIIIDGNIFD